jgi:hypothetical protein
MINGGIGRTRGSAAGQLGAGGQIWLSANTLYSPWQAGQSLTLLSTGPAEGVPEAGWRAVALGLADGGGEDWEDWQLTLQKIIKVAVLNKRAAVRF